MSLHVDGAASCVIPTGAVSSYLPSIIEFAPANGAHFEVWQQQILCAAFRFAYKPSQMKPFGRSRISRDAMGLIDGANRILLRTEANEEFYAYPK